MQKFRPHVLVACLLAGLQLTGLPGALHNALLDLRFDWLSRPATGTVAIVAIDSPSIEKVGLWPWPRSLHAQLVEKLEAAGATEIAFDIDFSSASTADGDRAFAEALKSAGSSVVLPSFEQRAGGINYVTRPLPMFADQTWSALVNVRPDSDGILRRYPFGGMVDGEFMPSMAALLAGKFDKIAGPFAIDFGIRADTVPSASFIDVLDGNEKTRALLKGKKIIVGGTALELGDRFNVPNGRIISGPTLQALAAESVSQGRALQVTSSLLAVPAIAVLMLLMIAAWRFGPLAKVVTLGIVALAVEAGAVAVQAEYPVIVTTAHLQLAVAGYLAAVALDEIDFRGLLSAVAQTRFERIAMSLGDGLVCFDAARTVSVWNPGAARIFGFSADEIRGQPMTRLFPNDDWLDAVSSLAECVAADNGTHGLVVELEGVRKSGQVFPLEASFSQWQAPEGMQWGAILRDISERKREAERIRYLAEFDTLTGLANRYTLTARLTNALPEAAEGPVEVALLVVGIDRFQQINEVQGHRYGDEVIRAAAARIKTMVGGGATAARLGADEFAILLVGATASQQAERIAHAVSRGFNDEPLQVGDRTHRVKVSVGIATCRTGSRSADELLGNAHLALSRAKVSETEDYVFFRRAFRDDLQARLQLEAELYVAIENGELELYYQPQINLADGVLVGAEALIRWRHPMRGVLAPAAFMPVVNTSPISEAVANWVMKTAFEQCRTWQLAGRPIRVGVNLSPSQLNSGDLAASVTAMLARTECASNLVELEVTEDILLMNDSPAIESFRRLQALGVHIAFDDFGTGYASMTHLKNFPLDTLKIDKSFVMELFKDPYNAAIVQLTIGLAQSLNLTVIAEGIEDERTARQLAAMGCIEGQGYHFSRPVPAAEFERKFLTGAPAKSAASAA